MSKSPDTIRPLPHALGVEKAVLSVIFQYPEKLQDAHNLGVDHFHLPSHRTIFALVSDLAGARKEIELVTFIEILRERGQLDRAGGPSALTDIYTYQATPSSFEAHVEKLTENLARRRTIAAAHEMERAAYEAAETVEILETISAPITSIQELLTASAPPIGKRDILRECADDFEKLCRGEITPMGIETSLDEINRKFRGLHPGQTIVVSGYPGGGKTTLAAQLAMDAALADHNALVCSLEMTRKPLMSRMLAYAARLPGKAITEPLEYCRETYGVSSVTKEVLMGYQRALGKINNSPFEIEEMMGANAHKIATSIRRAHRKSPLKVVVVDFAQRIAAAPELRGATKEQQLCHASNHLADLARELGFCLILPSQLNKDGAAKHAEAINEDADLHLQIVQDRSGSSASHKHIGIAVQKDRHHGRDGDLLPIVLDGPMLRFIPKPFAP